MIRTLEQRRSLDAMKAVQAFKRGDLYKYMEGLPASIAQNGLMAVLLSLQGAKRKPNQPPPIEKVVLDTLTLWLSEGEHPFALAEQSAQDPVTRIAKCSAIEYRNLHEEALQYSIWLKRWAAALKPDDAAQPADKKGGKKKHHGQSQGEASHGD